MFILAACVIAFIVTVASIVLLKPLAIRLSLVDVPGGRKQHARETPIIGGIAMFLGFIFAILLLDHSLQIYRSLLAGFMILVFVGVLDDFHDLSTRARLIAQIVAAILVACLGHIVLKNLGDLFFLGPILLNSWAIPFTIVTVVGVINAVNFSDGTDGYSGSITFVQLAFLAYFAYSGSLSTDFAILLLLMSALLGFLLFNFPYKKYATVFMGDAGSMFLGLALSWFLIHLSQGSTKIASPVTMLWIMSLPLFDMFTLFIYRLCRGLSPFTASREHFHFLLLDRGFSRLSLALLGSSITVILGGVGVMMNQWHIADGISFFAWLGLFLVFYIGMFCAQVKKVNN